MNFLQKNKNFFLKNKKIFLIIAFVLFVFLIAYAMYILFFPKRETPKDPEEIPSEEIGSPGQGLPSAEIGEGQIVDPGSESGLKPTEGDDIKIDEKAEGGVTRTTAINNTPSLGAFLDKNGRDLKYYDQSNGKFYRINNNGEKEELSEKTFHNVESVTWSPSKNKAILEYPDGANIIYDFDEEKQITLPNHWEDFGFSDNGDKIALKSIGLDPTNRWLAVTSEDGSKTVPIESIGINADSVYPSWSPNGQTIAVYTEGIDFNRQEIFFVGQNNENFKSLTVEGRNFKHKWSPNGKKIVYSVSSSDNDLKPTLWVAEASGDNIGNNRNKLNIDTWVDKCVFANTEEIYCAVPKELKKGSGLFSDLANSGFDDIYKININSGAKEIVAVPDGNYSASNLIISEDGRYLYFTDNNSKNINKINLK
jgi:Tol biopolymer transport system component